MIGLEITSKESGLPLFAYEFRPDTLFTDSDIRGGLITAIMRVMGETFGQQETRIVNYGNYNAILAEGKFVYGILFTFQTGPIFEKFIAKVVEDFEQQFSSKLENLASPNGGINSADFDFSKELVEAYNALLHIDETKLSKLLDKIYSYQDRLFDNMIIFLRPEMSQLYTHLVSERFSIFSSEVSTAIKTLLDLSNRTSFPIENFHIALTTNFHCLMFNIFPYTVVIFVDEDNLNTSQWRIKEIIKAFVEG